jgi:hypothetical protein
VGYVSGGRVILAVLVVVAGCVGSAAAVEAARRSRNWLWVICALGSAAMVTGIAAQRTFPSDGAVRALGQDAADKLPVGPWDAGVSLPGLGLRVTPVALGGFLVAVAGLSLVLFFEPDKGTGPLPPVPLRRLEEDDAV